MDWSLSCTAGIRILLWLKQAFSQSPCRWAFGPTSLRKCCNKPPFNTASRSGRFHLFVCSGSCIFSPVNCRWETFRLARGGSRGLSLSFQIRVWSRSTAPSWTRRASLIIQYMSCTLWTPRVREIRHAFRKAWKLGLMHYMCLHFLL
jgi:hypothetical protein